jgi:hypothetical protein
MGLFLLSNFRKNIILKYSCKYSINDHYHPIVQVEYCSSINSIKITFALIEIQNINKK